MYSNLVPFESVLERVKDDTGITILKNQYPKMRRLIWRIEHDLGYGGSVILRRVKYKVSDGTILYDGSNYKLKLPNDVVHLESIGMCRDGICPGDYRIQGNWMFFCGKQNITEFSLIYYTLLTDGEGNPCTTENHLEAISAGIPYYLYRPRRFKDKGSRSTYKDLEAEYHERLAEARGDDVWPDTMEKWDQIARVLRKSSRDMLMWSDELQCFCEIPESLLTTTEAPGGTQGGGGGYTDTSNVVPGGGTSGTGAGGSTDGEGAYPDPNEPVDPVDPEPEPINQPPTIEDISVTVDAGVTTTFTIAMIEGMAGSPYSDPENDALADLRADAINPYNTGTFFFNGIPVMPDMTISRAQIIAGGFTHVGGDNTEHKTDYLSFSVRDGVNGTWVS